MALTDNRDMAPRLELYAFRYRDPRTGKWTTARYRAERHEIAARYTEWEIIGPPEIREVNPDARYLTASATLTRLRSDSIAFPTSRRQRQ